MTKPVFILAAVIAILTAVELTLKQFPSVKRVIVSLNGDAKFQACAFENSDG